jgi:hypothetical protein
VVAIAIYNMLGTELYNSISNNIINFENKIVFTNLKLLPGAYMLQIKGANAVLNKAIVIE